MKAQNKHIDVRGVPVCTDAGRVSRLLLVAYLAAGVIASVWIVQSLRLPEPSTSIASDELGTVSAPLGNIGEAAERSDDGAAEVDSDSDDDSAAEEAEEQQQQDEEQEQLQQQQEALDRQQLGRPANWHRSSTRPVHRPRRDAWWQSIWRCRCST